MPANIFGERYPKIFKIVFVLKGAHIEFGPRGKEGINIRMQSGSRELGT